MVGLLNKAFAVGCMVFAVHANAQTEAALEGEERPKEVRYNLCDCLEDDRKEEGTLFYYTDLFLDGDSVVNMEIHWSYSKLENGKANSDIAVYLRTGCKGNKITNDTIVLDVRVQIRMKASADTYIRS